MRIIELFVQNIQRIKTILITPDKNFNIIAGKNAQGKSSTLDAIMIAFIEMGKVPENLINRDAEGGVVQIKLDNGLIIKKEFIKDKKAQLKVYDSNGELKTPQTILDKFYNAFSFDVSSFLHTDKKKQFETLCKIVGFEPEKYKTARQLIYDDRTLVNRQVRDAEGKFRNMLPPQPNLPNESQSLDDLRNQYKISSDKKVEYARLTDKKEAFSNNISAKEKEIEELHNKLVIFESALEKMKSDYIKICLEYENFELPDINSIEGKIKEAEQMNKAIDYRNKYSELENEIGDYKQKSEQLTLQLENFDKQVKETISTLKFPISNLSLSENGDIYYNDIVYDKCSQSERIEVAFNIARTLNPELKVILCRDASLFDDVSMNRIKQLAYDYDLQLFLERVGIEDNAIIIEDGELLNEPTKELIQ